MNDTLLIASAVATILGIVVMIMKLKVDPVIALVVGAIALGLAGGLGAKGAVEAAITGFGELMTDIGLLIAFGVLLGALLSYMGAIEKLVAFLLKTFGPKSMPYTFGVTIGVVLPSIFVDVMLVMVAPLARSVGPKIGKNGVGRIATAIAIGLECGLTMMIPGVAALALSGLLDVPLGSMLIYGTLVAAATITTSIAIMTLLFRLGFWNEDKDEAPFVEPEDARLPDGDAEEVELQESDDVAQKLDSVGDGRGGVATTTTRAGSAQATQRKDVPLSLALAPLVGALGLVALGAISSAAEWENPVLDLVTEPTIAILLGLISAFVVCRAKLSRAGTESALAKGFRSSGQILILTGVGGCLAQVVQEVGLGEIIQEDLGAASFAPLLIVWVIAALLHIAIGSVTTSAITAAGILAPIAATMGINPVLIALSAGAGAMFLIHVTSNTFWLLQSLLGQTTRGTLKTCSFGVSVASVVGLAYVVLLGLFV